MMKYFCKFLYQRYPDLFRDLIMEDLIGEIPDKTLEPASEFFATAGKKFEKYTLYQSWVIQRKMNADPSRATFYAGMIFLMKLQLILSARPIKRIARAEVKKEKETTDPMEGVDAFLKGHGIK